MLNQTTVVKQLETLWGYESDLATAEQDSRQKQARIERLEKAVKELRDALAELEEAARCVQAGYWAKESIDLERRKARIALKNTEDT